MPDFNAITLTKHPDPTTKIITLDIVNDGISDNGTLRNVNLIVDGTELKGIEFLTSGDPLEFGDNSRAIGMLLRTPDSISTCTVRHLAAGVAADAQILVTGSVFADALLTPADASALWTYDVADDCFHTRLNLWAPVP